MHLLKRHCSFRVVLVLFRYSFDVALRLYTAMSMSGKEQMHLAFEYRVNSQKRGYQNNVDSKIEYYIKTTMLLPLEIKNPISNLYERRSS